ncbi:protein MAIN-LIKE 1-like isoform X6 [Fagus crenata]
MGRPIRVVRKHQGFTKATGTETGQCEGNGDWAVCGRRKEYSLRARGGLQGLPAWWGKIHPPIGAKIRAAGLGFFLDAISHHLTEHKDLILMCAMSERFWDTTNTFHLPKIGEMTLTPKDFTMISGLSFGGHWLVMDHEIEGKKKQLKESLGTMPQYVRDTSVKLTWLKSTFEYKKLEDKCNIDCYVRAFMLYLIGTTFVPSTSSIVNLRFMASLWDVHSLDQYNWGGAAYATMFHYMAHFSCKKLKSLRGLLNVWAYEYLHLGTPSLNQQKADTFPRLSRWTSANRVSSTKPRSKLVELRRMIDNLTPEDVNWNPWFVVNLPKEFQYCQILLKRRVLFECAFGRYLHLGERVFSQTVHKYSPRIPKNPHVTMRRGRLMETSDLESTFEGFEITNFHLARVKNSQYFRFCEENLLGPLVETKEVQSEGMVSEEGSNLERRMMPSTPYHENRSGFRPFSKKYPSFPPWEVPMINAEGVMEMQPIPRLHSDFANASYTIIESLKKPPPYQLSSSQANLDRQAALLEQAKGSIWFMEDYLRNMGHSTRGGASNVSGVIQDSDLPQCPSMLYTHNSQRPDKSAPTRQITSQQGFSNFPFLDESDEIDSEDSEEEEEEEHNGCRNKCGRQ